MPGAPARFVHQAVVELAEGVDPAAPGGAVTRALCADWNHDGPCRWPHNNEIELTPEGAVFRTLFVAAPSDEEEVRARIDGSLSSGTAWVVLGSGPRPVSPSEHPLAERLLATPP